MAQATTGYKTYLIDDNQGVNGESFKLDKEFTKKFIGKKPKFGFNGFGECVFYRTYSRIKPDGSKETFPDTAIRVVEGCYEIQRLHCKKFHIPWNPAKAQRSAQEMFQRMWDFKFLPPGRGLWMMGTDFMWQKGSASLNNCGFCSTDDQIEADPAEPFCFLMDMSLLGVGIGFDTKGAGKIKIYRPNNVTSEYVISDSREGWVDSVRKLIHSYTLNAGNGIIEFDYSVIRPAGAAIGGFGGKAAGPGILMELHGLIRNHLESRIGSTLSSVDITDIMNYIGRCVVAGNVRRTAEIAFGAADDQAYCGMKNPTATLIPEEIGKFYECAGQIYKSMRSVATPEDFSDSGIPAERLLPAIETFNALNHHRWASNNSVFANVGMDYKNVGRQIAVNGEPGLIWLDNIRDYGRMIDGRQPGIDGRVMGTNPCFSGNMRLLTAAGYRTFEELWRQGGQMIYQNGAPLSIYGSMNIVNRLGVVQSTNVYKTSDSTEIFRVKFDDGQLIEATSNHRFVVVTDGQEKIVHLSDLVVGDKCPRATMEYFGEHEDREIALLAGWVIGDGSLSPRKSGQTTALVSCYENDIEDVMPILRDNLHGVYDNNAQTKSVKPNYTPWERKQKYFAHRQSDIRSSVLGRLLKQSGVESGDKHNIPRFIWGSNEATVSAFLKGLFSADGSVQVANDKGMMSVRLTQANEKLLRDCALLLSQFGIDSKVRLRRNPRELLMNDGRGGQKLYKTKAMFELIISRRDNVERFLERIGFMQDRKNSKIREWLDSHQGSNNSGIRAFKKIVSIDSIGHAPTYCLTEPESTLLTVQGQIIGNCVEQSLESYELCCLVETFPANHDDVDDYMRTLKFAYLYAKTVTLLPTHNARTNQVMLRNRRIGLSQSGIIQAFAKFGRRKVLTEFCDAGYQEIKRWDTIYADWLCIQKSIKVTSVKPSGSVSLLANATPGIHYPEARTYWRTMRLAKDSVLVRVLSDAGYRIEPDMKDKDRTVVVYFGVVDERVESIENASIWQQMANAIDYQRYWADNQVSCTVKFKSHEVQEISKVLEVYEDQLKGISFLPYIGHNYPQAPYIPCTKAEVDEYNATLKDVDYSEFIYEAAGSKFCDGDSCETNLGT